MSAITLSTKNSKYEDMRTGTSEALVVVTARSTSNASLEQQILKVSEASKGSLRLSTVKSSSLPLASLAVNASAVAVHAFDCSGQYPDISSLPSFSENLCTAVAFAPPRSTDPKCSLRLNIYTGVGEATLSNAACLAFFPTLIGAGILHGHLSVAAALYPATGASQSAVIGVAVTYSVMGVVYGASACLDLSVGSLKVNDVQCGSQSKKGAHRRMPVDDEHGDLALLLPLQMWVGSAPSVSFIKECFLVLLFFPTILCGC